jgi:2'-5' RNA ligase
MSADRPAGQHPRLFVGVWPDAETTDRLAALERVERRGVRWVRPDQCHVTLRFLGAADPDRVVDALRSVHHPPVTAVLGPRVGRLGRGVLMVPVGGLDSLAAEVIRCTAELGRPPDPRPFLGHLTLARLKGSPACGLIDAELRSEWPVTSIRLVASETGVDGPEYHVLADVPLRRRRDQMRRTVRNIR